MLWAAGSDGSEDDRRQDWTTEKGLLFRPHTYTDAFASSPSLPGLSPISHEVIIIYMLKKLQY